MPFYSYNLSKLLIVLLIWTDGFVSAARDECYTAAVIIGTLFASLLIALLIFVMVYLAYIRPRYEQYQKDVAECRAKHRLSEQAAFQSEPEGDCRPDQSSLYSANANTPFIITVRSPTPQYANSQGHISPYRAAYLEAMSTASRPTSREDYSRRYSSDTTGIAMGDNTAAMGAYRVIYRHPYDLPTVTEEDPRDTRGISSILAVRTATTAGLAQLLDPIGTRV